MITIFSRVASTWRTKMYLSSRPSLCLRFDVRLHGYGDLGDHDIRHLAGEPLGAMQVKSLDGADRKRLLDTGAAADAAISTRPEQCASAGADRLVALIVPDHRQQVLRLFVAKGRRTPN